MVKSFSIAKKPRVLFGVGLTTEAPKELKKAGCKNIFVLSDPVLKKMGAFQPLYDALDSEGLDYVICDEFDRDPTDVMVNHVASIAVEAKIDGIIGIGSGGNYAMAAAKALYDIPGLSLEEVAQKAMQIAGDIDVYTNHNVILESIKK